MKARIRFVRIDWLGNADINGISRKRGHLICGPIDGEYVVNLDGSPVRFKADEVRIQLVKHGSFVLGTEAANAR